jgi:hypothetical protein
VCLICADLAKGKLTLNEARRNLREFRATDGISEEHYGEVVDLIADKQGEEDYQSLLEWFDNHSAEG